MSSPRRTKIVATLGPASASEERLTSMVEAGMDVARLNCSHITDPSELAAPCGRIQRVAEAAGRPIATLLDLGGPKVRTGRLEGGSVELVAGRALRILPGRTVGSGDEIGCNHPGFASDVAPGHRVLLDDGLMELRVDRVDRSGVVHTEVVVGGELRERKGMNLPDASVSIPALTDKDKRDLAGAVDLPIDYVALSFVQSAQDIRTLKDELARLGWSLPIIAKIEKPQAVDGIDAILREVDGIMVARGDLAVEVGNHKVPVIQKELLRAATRAGVVDIVATQMLESMTGSPRPTRAEASDVANAILDGGDAVMLSAETAMGRYPVAAIAMMDRIAREVEPWMVHPDHLELGGAAAGPVATAVVRAAAGMAAVEQFRALIVFTLSGQTARLLGAYYPEAPILALTPNPAVHRAMALYRGVIPVLMPFADSSDQVVEEGEQLLIERGLLSPGDQAIVVAGVTELKGVANMVKVVEV